MIKSFGDKETEKLFAGHSSKKIDASIQKKAFRKLVQIHSSKDLNDLTIPPGNRLHQLQGNLKEYHSISINMQWRIIFKWNNHNAYDVEIIDYH
ncbi:type II toxin-antitoxin system RelE/ParE family toxin [Aquimarina agarilytica]|uniref:type II toxin-antitoxin system RelE/ParE family toxin n=1 Tax=Aquimarina agarilytica TaxID=1087449 RepID=UPI000287D4F7|nr:type II toxin-antitoxin system RelE/ParE family toxin [Aquimarina agarilytica]